MWLIDATEMASLHTSRNNMPERLVWVWQDDNGLISKIDGCLECNVFAQLSFKQFFSESYKDISPDKRSSRAGGFYLITLVAFNFHRKELLP